VAGGRGAQGRQARVARVLGLWLDPVRARGGPQRGAEEGVAMESGGRGENGSDAKRRGERLPSGWGSAGGRSIASSQREPFLLVASHWVSEP
jgi:hypothetical protein